MHYLTVLARSLKSVALGLCSLLGSNLSSSQLLMLPTVLGILGLQMHPLNPYLCHHMTFLPERVCVCLSVFSSEITSCTGSEPPDDVSFHHICVRPCIPK